VKGGPGVPGGLVKRVGGNKKGQPPSVISDQAGSVKGGTRPLLPSGNKGKAKSPAGGGERNVKKIGG